MLLAAVVILLVSYGICDQSPANRTNDESNTAPCSLEPYDLINPRIGENNDGEEISCCGYQQNKDEHPWIVAILTEAITLGVSSEVYICSGSLIHPIVVLTSAHCISKTQADSLKIRAGQTSDKIDDSYEREVSRSVIHEHYERRGLVNDIALLFLKEPLKMTKNVNTICLPPPNQVDLQRCFVSGWKRDKIDESGQYQAYLKTVELPIVNREKCVMGMRKTKFGQNYELHESFICAGGEIAKDTCEADGDLGAPLVCPIPNTINRYHQIGVLSWDFGLGNSMPGVYVNVPLFANWINDQLNR